MKLKETLNLENRASNAGWASNERTRLAKEWEDAKLSQRRQELNEGETAFHPFMMTSLCQRKYSRGTCHEQDLKRYHCSFQIYVRDFTPLILWLGYPWFAN